MPPTTEDPEQHSIIQEVTFTGFWQNIPGSSNNRLKEDTAEAMIDSGRTTAEDPDVIATGYWQNFHSGSNDRLMEDNYSTSGENEYIFNLSNDLQEIAENDLDESPQVQDEFLQSLRSWIKSQPHLKNIQLDANFLLRFLRMQKFSLPKTQMVLDKYIDMRVQHPNWFQNLDIRDNAIHELVTNGYLFVLPERDQNGRKVIFSVARNLDPSRHTNSDAMRAHLITFEALLEDEENQIRGISYIKSVTFSNLDTVRSRKNVFLL